VLIDYQPLTNKLRLKNKLRLSKKLSKSFLTETTHHHHSAKDRVRKQVESERSEDPPNKYFAKQRPITQKECREPEGPLQTS
jgi:hypothetical protein